MSVHLCGWVLDEQIPENILRFLEFEDGGISTAGRMSQQNAQKVRTSHPPNPGTPGRAFSQARPQRVMIRGVPSGAHGATNKEHHVCARR